VLQVISIPLQLFITAAVATFLAGYVCSTSGVFVVRMNLSAIGFTMSHAAFAGAAFGVWQDFDPLLGALAFAVVTALALGPVSERARLKAEVMLGFLFSLLMALGFLFLSITPGQAASSVALRIIWGSIFAVSGYDVLALGVLAAAILMFTVGFGKELMAMLFDRKLARAAGVNDRAFYYAALFITGLSVALSLKLVGGLLVYALIINPASTAYQFSSDMKRIMWASPVIGIVTSLGGFLLSLQLDMPVGSSIIIVSALTLAVAISVSPKRRRSGWRGAIPRPSPH
jgi:ABC-type Mn2+/Zn2+ transport system permease subunit